MDPLLQEFNVLEIIDQLNTRMMLYKKCILSFDVYCQITPKNFRQITGSV